MLLKRMGIRHFAYYPDDFLANQPGSDMLRRVLSTYDSLQGLAPGRSAPTAEPQPPAVAAPAAPRNGRALSAAAAARPLAGLGGTVRSIQQTR